MARVILAMYLYRILALIAAYYFAYTTTYHYYSPIQAVLVPTSETVCFRYFLDLLMANRRPVMLVGNAGSGKTVLINNKLASLDGDETLVTTIPLNYYTNSLMLQQVGAFEE